MQSEWRRRDIDAKSKWNKSELEDLKSGAYKWIPVITIETNWDHVSPIDSKWVQVESNEERWPQCNTMKINPRQIEIKSSHWSWVPIFSVECRKMSSTMRMLSEVPAGTQPGANDLLETIRMLRSQTEMRRTHSSISNIMFSESEWTQSASDARNRHVPANKYCLSLVALFGHDCL